MPIKKGSAGIAPALPKVVRIVRNNKIYRVFKAARRRRAANAKPKPPKAAKSSVEGSGTAAGLPLKLAAAANVPLDPLPLDPVSNALVSAAIRPEPLSARGEASVEGQRRGR